jgi:hypothetical protein
VVEWRDGCKRDGVSRHWGEAGHAGAAADAGGAAGGTGGGLAAEWPDPGGLCAAGGREVSDVRDLGGKRPADVPDGDVAGDRF